MDIIYKLVQSNEKPLEIDVDSSASGVYIRRNIEELEKETDTGEKLKYYQYQETFLTLSEYESYSTDLLVGKINDEDNTAEYEQYKNNLNTPQLYTNGKYYKPTWAEIYSGKVKEIFPMVLLYEKVGGETSVILDLKITIYDATGKVANAEMMSVKEIIELWLFLLKKQEEFFNIYKASLNK